MTKFTPFHGAPSWKECISGSDGTFHEDWRLMNCLNFVFKPHAFESVEQMERQYNQVISSFYRGKAYRKRFKSKIWEHRWTIWHMLKNAWGFFKAYQHFTPDSADLDKYGSWPALHKCQPPALPPAKPNDPPRRFAGAKWSTTPKPPALITVPQAALGEGSHEHGHDHDHG